MRLVIRPKTKPKPPSAIADNIRRKIKGKLRHDIFLLPNLRLTEKIYLYRKLSRIIEKTTTFSEIDRGHIMGYISNSLPDFVAYRRVKPRVFVATVETIFNIFNPKPEKKFDVHFKLQYVMPDGHILNGVYMASVKGIGEFCLFNFKFNHVLNRYYIEFVQGIKGVDMRKVNQALGKLWFEAIVDEILASARPIFASGNELYFFETPHAELFSKIRDRYLESKPSPKNGLYRFSRRKRRVVEILGLDQQKEIK
ncbi:MAG: hypothetical protein N3F05_02685 [Candidatus Diapherotrites archaeon]|nr:hypothetical protein [Candidatus Diapherotrites archaeon]